MTNILRSCVSFLVFMMTFSIAFASNTKPFSHKDYQKEVVQSSPFAGMSIKDFLTLTPKKYRTLTGKKLSVAQKIYLKIAQYKVKRFVRKNRQVDLQTIVSDVDTNNFDILGFILGVALGPIGVLIAYLLEGKSSSTFTWAVIGALIWLGLFLLVVLVL